MQKSILTFYLLTLGLWHFSHTRPEMPTLAVSKIIDIMETGSNTEMTVESIQHVLLYETMTILLYKRFKADDIARL